MRRHVLWGSVLVFVLLLAGPLSARPGGGQSYSGGSSSGSSSSTSRSSGSSSYGSSSSSSGSSGSSSYGSSGGSGDAPSFLWMAAFLIVGWIVVSSLSPDRDSAHAGLDLGGPLERSEPPTTRDDLVARVLAHDADFSLVLFEDFVATLYAQVHRARHDAAALAALSPYLAPDVSAQLAQRPGRVEAVVVGSLWLEDVRVSAEQLELAVLIDSNLHAVIEGRAATQYVRERFRFARALAQKTRLVRGTHKLGCPSCGAPFRPQGDGRCEACGQAVGSGSFDWRITHCFVLQEEQREHTLTGTVPEEGTSASTLFQPFVSRRREELTRDDPAVTLESLEARLRLINSTLLAAWAARDLRPVRPFLSERQYVSLQYWLDAYQTQGLRNVVAEPRLERAIVVRVERDRHYDAVVMRFWATGFDYTEELASGKVVGGSHSTSRRYSEYWTLVRAAGVRSAPRTDKSCPACGGPLDVNMSGECEHCGVHVTSGEFDWVLSKIEQDEAFRG